MSEVVVGISSGEIIIKVPLSFIREMLRELKKRTGAPNLAEAVEFIHWAFTGKELEDVMVFVKIYRLAKTGDTKPPLTESDLERMYREVEV